MLSGNKNPFKHMYSTTTIEFTLLHQAASQSPLLINGSPNMLCLKTKMQVHAFLWFDGDYQSFMLQLSIVASPLSFKT